MNLSNVTDTFVSKEQHDKDMQDTRKAILGFDENIDGLIGVAREQFELYKELNQGYEQLTDISTKLIRWYFRMEKKQNEAKKTIIVLGIAIIVEFAANVGLLWFILNAL